MKQVTALVIMVLVLLALYFIPKIVTREPSTKQPVTVESTNTITK